MSKQSAEALQLQHPLERNAVERSQSRFKLTVPRQLAISVSVHPRGADTRASIHHLTMGEVCASDTVVGEWEPEKLICILQGPGEYILQVDVTSTSSPQPHYTVEWAEAREVQRGDDERVKLQNKLAAASRALKLPKPDVPRAITLYNEAATEARVAGNAHGEATALLASAVLEPRRDNHEAAARLAERSAELYRAAGDRAGEASARNEGGWIHFNLGQHDRDFALQKQALELWRAAGDRRGEALTYSHLGRQYMHRRNRNEALEVFNKALMFYREQGDAAGESNILDYLGNLHLAFGDKPAAVRNFSDALKLVAGKDKLSEATTRLNIATIYQSLGEYVRASQEARSSAKLFVEAGDMALAARARMNLGSILNDLGKPAEALAYLQKALPELEHTSKFALAAALNNSARSYRDLGRFEEARTALERALPLFEELKHARGVRIAFTGLGRVNHELGNDELARKQLDNALRESREAGDTDQSATVLGLLARIESDAGQFDAARAGVDAALELVESGRARLARDDLRSAYFSIVRPLYELKADVLMQLHKKDPGRGWHKMAFEISEAARARSLLEVMPAVGSRLAGVSSELLEKEAVIRQQIRVALQSRENSVDDLLSELQSIQGQIRAASPRYAEAAQARPVGFNEAARHVDSDTVVLEYMLGEVRSYLWVLRDGEIQGFELPGNAQIDKLATTLRNRAIAQAQAQAGATASKAYWSAAATLSKVVLGPARELLTKKRIAIVADGALQLVPFAALPMPGATGTESRIPLVVARQIIMLQSLSVLAYERQRRDGRSGEYSRIAVIADPVYRRSDERFGMTAQSRKESRSADTRSVAVKVPDDLTTAAIETRGSVGGARFDRLEYSRDEVNAIVAATAGRVDVLTGFDATVSRVAGSALSRYDVVHFATHGFLNEQRPDLSGLVLTLVDRQGRPIDGFFRLLDVYSLDLNARLVVLSACDTARGRDMRGEGVVGLTRGFLFAGAERTLSSLWPVRDNATAAFMRYFYEAMLGRKVSPSEALQSAQIAMWKQRRWRAPYFWSGFVIHGEWRS